MNWQLLIEHNCPSKFQAGMSWENYGAWEIDHKFPISKFPSGTPVSTINALDNLQPLWKAHNRKKHAHVSIQIPSNL